MSHQYTPSNLSPSIANQASLAVLATAILFGIIPALHCIPNLFIDPPPIVDKPITDDPPPAVVEPPKPKPPPKRKKPKIELEKPLPKPNIDQLPFMFVVGDGDGDYSLDSNYREMFDSEQAARIFDPGELEKKPKALFQVEPMFPYELRQSKLSGAVLLEWIITDRGEVRRIRVIQSSHRAFNQPAIDSILKSRWIPGEHGGKAVSSRVRQTITFRP